MPSKCGKRKEHLKLTSIESCTNSERVEIPFLLPGKKLTASHWLQAEDHMLLMQQVPRFTAPLYIDRVSVGDFYLQSLFNWWVKHNSKSENVEGNACRESFLDPSYVNGWSHASVNYCVENLSHGFCHYLNTLPPSTNLLSYTVLSTFSYSPQDALHQSFSFMHILWIHTLLGSRSFVFNFFIASDIPRLNLRCIGSHYLSVGRPITLLCSLIAHQVDFLGSSGRIWTTKHKMYLVRATYWGETSRMSWTVNKKSTTVWIPLIVTDLIGGPC